MLVVCHSGVQTTLLFPEY